ncbi:MAG: hypothetical protein R3300_02210 [Candidatus Promineifilaceae bacterium]|nr:hypothetical protein [Candidatus Promineifilaceae bacterium]
MRDFYGLSHLAHWSHYAAVALATILWVLLVHFIWRANLVERYLNVDLGHTGDNN